MIESYPIRVLCVFSSLDRGGAESMCMNLYRHIDRTKVQFDFVKHTSSKGSFEDEIHDLGGRVYTAPRYRIYNYNQYKNWWISHLEEHPEHKIIHGHFFTISAVYFKFGKRLGRICIGHAHSSKRDAHDFKTKCKLILISKIEKYSDYCFSCSKESGEWLFPNKEYIVLKNAIDINSFSLSSDIRTRMRREFSIDDETLLIGHVGNISAAKNHSFILDIFVEIKKLHQNSKLILIGAGSQDELRNKAKEAGIDNEVIFTGVRNDVNCLLQAMDVFVFPSIFEGLPVTVIEAQASGLKCFLSNRITDEVNVTGNCEFLPIDDALLWAKLINSADLTRKDCTQRIMESGYDIDTTALWLQNFYLQIEDK